LGHGQQLDDPANQLANGASITPLKPAAQPLSPTRKGGWRGLPHGGLTGKG